MLLDGRSTGRNMSFQDSLRFCNAPWVFAMVLEAPLPFFGKRSSGLPS
jgi:hypothetical protein